MLGSGVVAWWESFCIRFWTRFLHRRMMRSDGLRRVLFEQFQDGFYSCIEKNMEGRCILTDDEAQLVEGVLARIKHVDLEANASWKLVRKRVRELSEPDSARTVIIEREETDVTTEIKQ